MLSKVLRNTTPSLRALRQVTPVAKAFSSSPIAKAQGEITREPIETPLSLWNFTEEEEMIRQTGPVSIYPCQSRVDEQ
jgi:short/branched chain acyl-CoA dehydrogenase